MKSLVEINQERDAKIALKYPTIERVNYSQLQVGDVIYWDGATTDPRVVDPESPIVIMKLIKCMGMIYGRITEVIEDEFGYIKDINKIQKISNMEEYLVIR